MVMKFTGYVKEHLSQKQNKVNNGQSTIRSTKRRFTAKLSHTHTIQAGLVNSLSFYTYLHLHNTANLTGSFYLY